MKLTYNLKPCLRTDKKKASGESPIYWSLRVGATTTRIPTGKSISAKDWCKAEACPKKNTPINKLLASYLTKQLTDWQMFMLTQENLGKQITLTMASNYFKENTKVTLFSFWNKELELWQNTKRENTLKSYKSTLKMIQAFNCKLNFGDLTYDMIMKFDLFMANEKNNALGGRFVKHKCLKAMCNEAIKKGFMNKNPYVHFKIKTSNNKREFLSIAEVRTLIKLEVPHENVFQQKTLDLFLFSVFTGLRYSDVMNLKWQDVIQGSLTVNMTKTSKQVTIPLTQNASIIIEKYGKHIIKVPTANVFPQIANQVLNRNLKDLMKSAGINKNVTYHVSRHSFASNLLEANTNIMLIKDLMGHSRIAETQVYAKAMQADLITSITHMQNVYDMPQAI